MNRIKLSRGISHILFGLSIILPNFVDAANEVKEAQKEDECSQEILLSYFPGVFVSETLTKFNIPKDQWEKIKQELLARDKEIIKQVEAKAAKMTPNPLKDPEQRQAAIKLFRETLFENFSGVMKSHGIQDDKQIQSMLDDIQQQKAKRFAHCMELQRNAQPRPKSGMAPAPKKDKDDDKDDDSDDVDDDNKKPSDKK